MTWAAIGWLLLAQPAQSMPSHGAPARTVQSDTSVLVISAITGEVHQSAHAQHTRSAGTGCLKVHELSGMDMEIQCT